MTVIAALAASIGFDNPWLHTPDKPRAELERKYLTARSDYVDVAGLRLHVRDTGPKSAPAVLLLHGFGASLHTWESWSQALSAQWRVVRFDLPGSGLTGPDPADDYSDGRSIEVIDALLTALGIASAMVVGHSIGGRIAWKFAARRPQRVDKLVLIAPDGFASSMFRYGQATRLPFIFRLTRHVLPKSLVRMALASVYAQAASRTEERVTRYHDLLLAPGVRAASLARIEQTILEVPEPILRTIQAPTLLLWGGKDAIIPATNAVDYARALPNSETVVLPELGHVPHEEGADATLEVLRSFLERDGPAAPAPR